jgi:hypothetical protein
MVLLLLALLVVVESVAPPAHVQISKLWSDVQKLGLDEVMLCWTWGRAEAEMRGVATKLVKKEGMTFLPSFLAWSSLFFKPQQERAMSSRSRLSSL